MSHDRTSGSGSHDVTMPQLGMAQDAGKIVSWLKAEGEAVAKGDALFEVETDKAVMEVEAQASGFLTGVSAPEGTEVPVGQVIARISDSADGTPETTPETTTETPAETTPEATSEATSSGPDSDTSGALPEGKTLTMPQLGMAQDSAVLVGWLKALGEAVDAEDILFEVETDKSTMEVPAGASGYLAATLAEPGEDVPVGQPVAVISAQKPEAPIARAAASAPPAAAKAADAPRPAPDKDTAPAPATARTPTAAPMAEGAPPAPGGKILASPKARRLARARGLDLARLVAAGYPQPYHVADLETLAALPPDAVTTTGTTTGTATAHALSLTASVPEDGMAAFATWAAQAHGLSDADALLAGLAGACLPGSATPPAPVTVAIARHGASRAFTVPPTRALSQVTATDDAPTLMVRDLRHTALRMASLGAEATPVLCIMASGDGGLTVVLECSPTQLNPDAAIHLLTQFAARLEAPLHHLL